MHTTISPEVCPGLSWRAEHTLRRFVREVKNEMDDGPACFCCCWQRGCTTNKTVVLNDNGGWCWYQDQRVLVQGDRLIVGSVANRAGTDGANRWGNVEITTYDLKGKRLLGTSVLHEHLLDDDHAAAQALLAPGGWAHPGGLCQARQRQAHTQPHQRAAGGLDRVAAGADPGPRG